MVVVSAAEGRGKRGEQACSYVAQGLEFRAYRSSALAAPHSSYGARLRELHH